MKDYGRMIRFAYGHYMVVDENGDFVESCDTYEEAQQCVDELVTEAA